jgi:hypothetical protein
LPNHSWEEAWYFAEYGNLGKVLKHDGITYASWFTGPSPDAIEAKGPVHGCDSGLYTFQTPLGDWGISNDEPVFNGAGAFVADFFTATDITWLDFAGPIELPELPEPPEAPPELPPEFFESPPEGKVCIRDFDGKLHCQEEEAAMVPGTNFIAHGQGRITVPGIAILVASRSGIIPHVKTIVPLVGDVHTSPLGSKVEVDCPAQLILTVTFNKDHAFDPAKVKYRFRFAHGPVSTVFSTLVDGQKSVSHSVPIPLPPPIAGAPGGGVPHGPGNNIAVVKVPPLVSEDPQFTVEALPPNEHKSSVRVEVINVVGGIVSSNWTPYHVVCTKASTRPILTIGARGAAVAAVQTGLNRWLQSQKMSLLKIDGIFGPRTEKAVRAFQNAKHLEVNGIVGLKVWKQLLSLRGEPGGHRKDVPA